MNQRMVTSYYQVSKGYKTVNTAILQKYIYVNNSQKILHPGIHCVSLSVGAVTTIQPHVLHVTLGKLQSSLWTRSLFCKCDNSTHLAG